MRRSDGFLHGIVVPLVHVGDWSRRIVDRDPADACRSRAQADLAFWSGDFGQPRPSRPHRRGVRSPVMPIEWRPATRQLHLHNAPTQLRHAGPAFRPLAHLHFGRAPPRRRDYAHLERHAFISGRTNQVIDPVACGAADDRQRRLPPARRSRSSLADGSSVLDARLSTSTASGPASRLSTACPATYAEDDAEADTRRGRPRRPVRAASRSALLTTIYARPADRRRAASGS